MFHYGPIERSPSCEERGPSKVAAWMDRLLERLREFALADGGRWVMGWDAYVTYTAEGGGTAYRGYPVLVERRAIGIGFELPRALEAGQ